jgi:C4-dicarboxylate-specific signal transduction histidine kinase
VRGEISVFVDITEHKRAEQALQESQAGLARVARIVTMGELTASIAHEINQPLAAVTTYAMQVPRCIGLPFNRRT